MSEQGYIHGYSEWEQSRLVSQNDVLAKYIYERLDFSGYRHILELGCGVGAQMQYLLNKYPDLHIVGVDVDQHQLTKAETNLNSSGIDNNRYELIKISSDEYSWMSILRKNNIQAVFTIWVLEHVLDVSRLLRGIYNAAPEGIHFYATETFHSGLHLYPGNIILERYWLEMMALQKKLGGDCNVGLHIGAIAHEAGFAVEWHRPFPMFFDINQKEKRNEMFVYWKSLMLAASESMKEAGYWQELEWKEIEAHMDMLLDMDTSVFYYNFFQMKAVKKRLA
jgi:SAM-dependent methyltransferase